MPDEERQLAGPPPREAIDYLKRKGIRPGFSYLDVWREEHAHAFTVAKMMDLDMLRDVRESITAAQEAGTTMEEWKRQMTEFLSKEGWWGRKVVEDPRTGKKVEAQLGSSRRLDTIWRVNIGQAAQAGVWERGQRSTSHPYVLYRVGPSRQHRDQHLAWDGLVLPKDSSFWSVANPRNGWGCKCHTRFVSAAQYRRYQRDGIPAPARGDAQPGKKRIETGEPVLRPTQYRNKRTGNVHTGYAGIDPGFERNPGVGRMEQLGEVFRGKAEGLAAADTVPTGTEVSGGLDVQVTDDLGASVVRAIDTIERVHGDGNLPDPIPVRQDERMRGGSGRFRSRGSLPVDITVKDSPFPEIVAAHEIGHFLDFSGLPGTGYQSVTPTMPEMSALLDTMRRTATWRSIRRAYENVVDGEEKSLWREMLLRQEAFARAYAQYIAWKSGDRTMLAQLDTRMAAHQTPRMRLRQWPLEEFLPIAQAMDTLFDTAGWLTRR